MVVSLIGGKISGYMVVWFDLWNCELIYECWFDWWMDELIHGCLIDWCKDVYGYLIRLMEE